MRTTVTIEDDLYKKALAMADPGMNQSELFREAIKTFVRIQAAKRLAALGGPPPKWKTFPEERRPPARERSGRHLGLDRSFSQRERGADSPLKRRIVF